MLILQDINSRCGWTKLRAVCLLAIENVADEASLFDPWLKLLKEQWFLAVVAGLLALGAAWECAGPGAQGKPNRLPRLADVVGKLVHHFSGVVRGRGNTQLLLTLGHSWVVYSLNIVAVVSQQDVGKFSWHQGVANLRNVWCSSITIHEQDWQVCLKHTQNMVVY